MCMLAGFVSWPLLSQTLISSTYTGSRTIAQITASTNYQAEYAIQMYKILYTTTGTDGLPDTASGLVTIPVTEEPIPALVYMHGTTNGPNVVPSNLNTDLGAIFFFGGQGYFTLAPDYLGLGSSRGFHPYCHAETEARAGRDMMIAVEAALSTFDVSLNGKYYITGYSQGGHAAMALQQMLETDHPELFNIRASAPLSGPYSISGVMRDLILSENVYLYGSYIPYVVLGYQEYYGNLYEDLSEVFVPGIVGAVQQFYEGNITLTQLNITMVTYLIANVGQIVPKFVLTPELIAAVENDSMHPVNVALRDNDTYKWVTEIPTRLFYCEADDQVPYQNSIVAAEYKQNAGSTVIEAQSVGANLSHGPCASPALLAAHLFFLETETETSVQTPLYSSSLTVYPNPSRGYLNVDWPGGANTKGESRLLAEVFDIHGRIVHTMRTENNANLKVELPNSLPEGIYLLRLSNKHLIAQSSFVLRR